MEDEALLRRARLCKELVERVLGVLKPPSEREDGAGERIGNIVLVNVMVVRDKQGDKDPCGSLSYRSTKLQAEDPHFTVELR